jgi:PPIC-type PPIASE domain
MLQPVKLEEFPPRSLIFLAAGALIGLGIAGFGLFTAKGTARHGVPPEDIALVNQHPLLRVDFVAQLATLYGVSLAQATREQRKKVLDDMIREELFVQRGLEFDFPSSDPDVRAALVSAVEQQVASDAAAARPSEAELESYYEEHKDRYSSDGMMTVHDLLLAAMTPRSKADGIRIAHEAAGALRRGDSIAAVTARYGLADSGKTKGEEFYFAARIHLGDALFTAATMLSDGGISEPDMQPDGMHILVMERNLPPKPFAFAEAKERVLNDYRRDAMLRLLAQEEKYLRGRARIALAPEFAR